MEKGNGGNKIKLRGREGQEREGNGQGGRGRRSYKEIRRSAGPLIIPKRAVKEFS